MCHCIAVEAAGTDFEAEDSSGLNLAQLLTDSKQAWLQALIPQVQWQAISNHCHACHLLQLCTHGIHYSVQIFSLSDIFHLSGEF